MNYENICVEREDNVGLIRLNRPKALNALNSALLTELNHALDAFERDGEIGCVLLTGSEKAFAAGADIREMVELHFPDSYLEEFFAGVERVSARRKPVIAAVAGYALGGGFELALACDFIIAADNARFALPEITLGVLPGGGGTQRLARLVGRARAMEMTLTGRQFDAAEAERCGVVARVVPLAELQASALDTARQIAARSRTAVLMIKECIQRCDESSLAEGLRFERRLFHAAFATADQKEGMGAFLEKRPAQFRR